MSKSTTTVEGIVSKDPEYRDVTGHSIVTVTVPFTPQKKNQQGEWEDSGDTIWYQAEFWDEHGTTVAQQVQKGSLVALTGTLEIRQWESNGKSGVGVKLTFPTISVVVRRPKRGQSGHQSPPKTTADEPWATSPGNTFDAETPF